jgi:hypothetical protein
MRKQQLDGAPAVPLFFLVTCRPRHGSHWDTVGMKKEGIYRPGGRVQGVPTAPRNPSVKSGNLGAWLFFFWSRKQQLDGAHIVPLFFLW